MMEHKTLAEIKSFIHDLTHLSHRRVSLSVRRKTLYIGCDCGKVFYDKRNPEEIELSKELIGNLMNKEYYLKIKYPFVTKKYYDNGKLKYLTEYPDLPGCSSYGETPEKSHAMAEEAKKLWIETCIKDGIQIPEPKEDFKCPEKKCCLW